MSSISAPCIKRGVDSGIAFFRVKRNVHLPSMPGCGWARHGTGHGGGAQGKEYACFAPCRRQGTAPRRALSPRCTMAEQMCCWCCGACMHARSDGPGASFLGRHHRFLVAALHQSVRRTVGWFLDTSPACYYYQIVVVLTSFHASWFLPGYWFLGADGMEGAGAFLPGSLPVDITLSTPKTIGHRSFLVSWSQSNVTSIKSSLKILRMDRIMIGN